MSRFSFKPALSLRGREYRGMRGFSGKPFHPPLTDIPITAYLFGAVFDVLSIILHDGHPEVGYQLYLAGTWVLLAGSIVGGLAATTGWLDRKTLPVGTLKRRTANAHATTMITVNTLVGIDLILRFTVYKDEMYSRPLVMIISVLAALLVSLGATIGGSLVYDHGVNVERGPDNLPPPQE